MSLYSVFMCLLWTCIVVGLLTVQWAGRVGL